MKAPGMYNHSMSIPNQMEVLVSRLVYRGHHPDLNLE